MKYNSRTSKIDSKNLAQYFVIFFFFYKYNTLQAIYNYVYAYSYIVCLKKPSHGYLRLGLKLIIHTNNCMFICCD